MVNILRLFILLTLFSSCTRYTAYPPNDSLFTPKKIHKQEIDAALNQYIQKNPGYSSSKHWNLSSEETFLQFEKRLFYTLESQEKEKLQLYKQLKHAKNNISLIQQEITLLKKENIRSNNLLNKL